MNHTKNVIEEKVEDFDNTFISGVRKDPRGRLAELEKVKDWLRTTLTTIYTLGVEEERARIMSVIEDMKLDRDNFFEKATPIQALSQLQERISPTTTGSEDKE